MALEYLNVARMAQRAHLNERAGDLKEQYGVDVPTFYEFCRAQGVEKPTFRQKAVRTATYSAVGAVAGVAALVAGFTGGVALLVAAAGAATMGTVALQTRNFIPAMLHKPFLNGYKAQLDLLEAQLSRENDDLLTSTVKSVGGAAIDMAKSTARGAAAVAVGAVSATADIAADGAEMVADAAAETAQKAASKTHDNFRDMVQTSRTELEQQAER